MSPPGPRTSALLYRHSRLPPATDPSHSNVSTLGNSRINKLSPSTCGLCRIQEMGRVLWLEELLHVTSPSSRTGMALDHRMNSP